MKRTHFAFALVAGAFLLSACQTVVKPLRQGTVSDMPMLSRTLVFLDAAEGPLRVGRDTVEADLAKRLAPIGGTPSSTLLGDTIQPLRDKVQDLAARAGFDGILILSLEGYRESRSPDVAFIPVAQPPGLGSDPVVVGVVSHSAVFRASLVEISHSREIWAAKITRHNADLGASDFRAVARAVVRQLHTDGILH